MFYSLSEFCAFCKLKIWSKGHVSNLGFVQIIKTIPEVDLIYNGKSFRSAKSYQNSMSYLRTISAGLYLLDIQYVEQKKDKNTFLIVLALARFGLTQKEEIFFFTVENGADLLEFKQNSFTGRPVSKTKMKLKKNTVSARRRHSGALYSYTRRY